MMIASCLAGLSVVLGAFTAHVLKSKVSTYYLEVFETACRYQMYHAFALFVVAFSLQKQNGVLLQISGFLFCLGIFIFCGSLYLLVLTKTKAWGMITPIGGLSFIVAWGCLAAFFIRL